MAAAFEEDPRWEFDAPKYYDFSRLEADPAPADEWFDTAPDGPGHRPKGVSVVPEGAREALAEIKQPSSTPAANQEGGGGQAGTEKKKKNNILTTWGGMDAIGTKRNFQQSQQAGGAAPAPPGTTGAPSSKLPEVRKAQRTAVQQQAANASATPAITRDVLRPRFVDSKGMTRVGGTADAAGRSQSVPPKARSLGVARPRAAKTPMPSKLRTTEAAMRRGAQTDLGKVLQHKIVRPARSTKPLTLPADFALHTAMRLRSDAPSEPQASPYKSLAVKVLEFQNKTPVRFRSKPGKQEGKAQHHQQHNITEAKTPVLWTSTRARPMRYKSRAEQEQEEAEALGRGKKAQEQTAAKSRPASGQRPAITETQPFHFRMDERAAMRGSQEKAQQAREQGDDARRLKPGSLKRSILDGPTFQPHKEQRQPTVPKSPYLRTKHLHHEEPKPESPRYNFRARPVPQYERMSHNIPYVPAKEVTKPTPFRLATDRRHQQYSSRERETLAAQERQEREARRVRARPLPLSTDMVVVPPRPAPRGLTLPQPFHLQSEARHEGYLTRRQQELQQQELTRKQEADFKAQPMWDGRPFVVHDSEASLTVPVDPHLATESRAPEREVFDRKVQDKNAAAEAEAHRQGELKRQREEQEEKEYRKTLKFKARPMPSFDQPMHTLPSSKPLTEAKTPDFASKRLARRSRGN